MATFWEKAAHSVDNILTIRNFSLSRFGFEGGIWFLIASIPGNCLQYCYFYTKYLQSVLHCQTPWLSEIQFTVN